MYSLCGPDDRLGAEPCSKRACIRHTIASELIFLLICQLCHGQSPCISLVYTKALCWYIPAGMLHKENQQKPVEKLPEPIAIDATTAPRFRQIVDVLRQDIVDGTLTEHQALPSERVIAEQHEVSRMTARRALEALELEGLAYNEQRRGRFVSPPRLTYDISRMVCFAADAQSAGTKLEIEVVSVGTVHADAGLATLLGVSTGTGLFAYTRVFRTGGHAIFIETEHVIASLCPGLLDYDLRHSTTGLLEQNYQLRAHAGDITIRMRGMKATEATRLGLQENHAGIELGQVVRDEKGDALCVGQQMWRGELAQFSARAIVNPGTP